MTDNSNEKYESIFNYNIFTVAMSELCKLCLEVSDRLEKETQLSEKILSRHNTLRSTCNKLIKSVQILSDNKSKEEPDLF